MSMTDASIDEAREDVERATISLTKELLNHEMVKGLLRRRRFSAHVEGLLVADLVKRGLWSGGPQAQEAES